jgi:hypothetical protein
VNRDGPGHRCQNRRQATKLALSTAPAAVTDLLTQKLEVGLLGRCDLVGADAPDAPSRVSASYVAF